VTPFCDLPQNGAQVASLCSTGVELFFHFTPLFIGLMKEVFYLEIEIMVILCGRIWLLVPGSDSSWPAGAPGLFKQ